MFSFLEAGLKTKEAYNIATRKPNNIPKPNNTRKSVSVITPPPTKRRMLYNRPEELQALKEQWVVNANTEALLQTKSGEELENLFLYYLKTKKESFLQQKRQEITQEGFTIIDNAASQYLDMLKNIMRQNAIDMVLLRPEAEISKLISETTKSIAEVSTKVTKVPNAERLDLIVEKEYLQFFLSVMKEALQMKKNNKYAPSTTEAPALNTSYLKERNFSMEGRKVLNNMTLRSNMGRNKPLTNSQVNARRMVAMKMAKGEPVSMEEKVRAGILTMPKPSIPKPSTPKPITTNIAYPKPAYPKPTGPKPNRKAAVGGRKTRRNRKQ